MRTDRKLSSGAAAGLLMAAVSSLAGVAIASAPRKERNRVPTMVTSSPTEIAAWNAEVERKRAPKRKAPRRIYETGQHPKFAPERQRKQHKHPLRDEHGALTLIGKPCKLIGVKPSSREFVIEGGSYHGERFYTVRRIWLAGISAQRGY